MPVRGDQRYEVHTLIVVRRDDLEQVVRYLDGQSRDAEAMARLRIALGRLRARLEGGRLM